MKTELKEIGKDNKKLIIRNGNYSIANIVKEELLKLDSIEFAGVNKEHPQKDNFIVVIRGKNIEDNIKKAIEKGKQRFKTIKSEIEEEWGK